jgi:SulP family sulfate permease
VKGAALNSLSEKRGGIGDWLLKGGAGILLGILITIGAFSFSRLIFAIEPLTPYGPLGFMSAMISAVVIGLIVGVFSSLAGVVAIPQDRIAPIYAMIVAKMIIGMPEGTDPSVAAIMALVVISFTALLTGLILLLLGRLRLGNMLRFIPYPVVGGFLAASGWLLVKGGLKLLTEGDPDANMMTWFAAAPTMVHWLPGLLAAVLLTFLVRTTKHPLIAPLGLIIAFGAFHGIVYLMGASMDDLRLAGLLPTGLQNPWEVTLNLSLITEAPWYLLAEQTGLIATILLTTFVSIVLSSSAIELMSNQEADLNHELRVTGMSNIAAGAMGGMVGFHSLSLSRFSLDLGIPGRAVPAIAAIACAFMIPAAPYVLPYVPNLIPGALLLLLGLLLLVEWLVDGYKKLSKADFSVVLIILISVALVGYLEGIVVGIIATVVLFIIKYSQVSVVTGIADGRQMHSNVERPPWHVKALQEAGERTLIVQLRGFIFFGRATELQSVIRHRAFSTEGAPLEVAILDFRRVTGFDSSAAMTLVRTLGLAQRLNFHVFLSGMNPRVTAELEAAGIGTEEYPVEIHADLDHALEVAENMILKLDPCGDEEAESSLREQLLHTWTGTDSLERFIEQLERVSFSSGDILIQQGDPADSILFVQSGHVVAWVESANGKRIRLRRQGAGTIVGEIGMYLDINRTASVVADSAGVAYRFTREELERISKEDPTLASEFHKFVVHNLSVRNAFINTSFHQNID